MAGKEEAKSEAPSGGKPFIKWIIMGVILLVFLGVEAGMAVYFVKKLKPVDKTIEAVQNAQEKEKAAEEQRTEMGMTLEKPIDVTVNIAGTNGERFLKSSVQLEWSASDKMLLEELNIRLPKIKNIIIDILSSKPLAELMTVEGKKAIRDAIVSDINATLPEEAIDKAGGEPKPLGKVQRAFFVEFVVQ